MSITEILTMDSTAEEKILAVQKTVAMVRKTYGNSDITIPVPDVRCAEGLVPLLHLNADSQLAKVTETINALRVTAREAAEDVVGLNLESYTQMLVATDAVLVNVGERTPMGVL